MSFSIRKLLALERGQIDMILKPYVCHFYVTLWLVSWPKQPTRASASAAIPDYQSVSAGGHGWLPAGIQFKDALWPCTGLQCKTVD